MDESYSIELEAQNRFMIRIREIETIPHSYLPVAVAAQDCGNLSIRIDFAQSDVELIELKLRGRQVSEESCFFHQGTLWFEMNGSSADQLSGHCLVRESSEVWLCRFRMSMASDVAQMMDCLDDQIENAILMCDSSLDKSGNQGTDEGRLFLADIVRNAFYRKCAILDAIEEIADELGDLGTYYERLPEVRTIFFHEGSA